MAELRELKAAGFTAKRVALPGKGTASGKEPGLVPVDAREPGGSPLGAGARIAANDRTMSNAMQLGARTAAGRKAAAATAPAAPGGAPWKNKALFGNE